MDNTMDATKQSTITELAFSPNIIGCVQEEAEACIAKFCDSYGLQAFKKLIDLYVLSIILLDNYTMSPEKWTGFYNNLVGIDAINHDISANFIELTQAVNRVNRMVEERNNQVN